MTDKMIFILIWLLRLRISSEALASHTGMLGPWKRSRSCSNAEPVIPHLLEVFEVHAQT